MFEDSLIESGGRLKTLIFTEAPPKQQLMTFLVAPPPPPPPPPPPAATPVRVVKQIQSDLVNGQLRTPTKIPQKVQMIKEDEAPPPEMSTGGVVGGVPGGVPGARQARIQGTVLLQAEISKDGTIENLRLINGHPMLAPAAIEAVKQWRYRPYMLNGEPVAVETQVQVNFTLSGG